VRLNLGGRVSPAYPSEIGAPNCPIRHRVSVAVDEFGAFCFPKGDVSVLPYAERIVRATEKLANSNFSHVIVTSVSNLLYLTGNRFDTGERMTVLLLSRHERPKLYLHEMFAERVTNELEILELVLWSDGVSPVDLVAQALPDNSVIGVDGSWPSAFLLELMKSKPSLNCVRATVIEKMREVKDADEIQILRQSSRIADAVVHQMMQLQALPTSELQMAEYARHLFIEHGAWELAFNPIICFGPNTANPHHAPKDIWLKSGQPITIDIGGIFNNYCSDITRTALYGEGNARFKEIYDTVLDTHLQALELIRPGLRFADLDLFIRNEFAKRGVDRYFIHRTGHGLGLEAHEGPFVHGFNQDEMEEGMVITVEPGIYLPGEFGVRVEDVVVVTATGCEVLTQSARDVKYLDTVNS
jgi:Xaa-Pro dipeptidase